MRNRRNALALTLLAAALAACGARREGQEAVRRYNDVVVAAYRQDDPSKLGEVATAKEARKLTALIALKHESEVVLESTLLRLEVSGVEKLGADRLTVKTDERWRYHDRPLTPGAPAGTEFLADMKGEYDLVREGGTWKVASVRIPWNQYYDPATERPIPRPDFTPKRGSGLAHRRGDERPPGPEPVQPPLPGAPIVEPGAPGR